MKFIELAKQRKSIRSYTDEPVSEEALTEILEAGRLAPTACNLQPFTFIVLRKKENLAALAKAYSRPWFTEAPVVIAICTKATEAWKREKHDNRCYVDVDAAIAADHMTLAAEYLSLGTCWIGAFNPKIVKDVLKTPEDVEPLILLTVGHKNETGREKKRKALDELVRHETW